MVAISDDAVRGQGQSAREHLVQQNAIRQVRALQRDHVLGPAPRGHQSIHFTGPEGTQGVLGRSQPVPQLFQLSRRVAPRFAFLDHCEP